VNTTFPAEMLRYSLKILRCCQMTGVNQRIAVTKRMIKEGLMRLLKKKTSGKGQYHRTLPGSRRQPNDILPILRIAEGCSDRNAE